MCPSRRPSPATKTRGLTLLELMIAMSLMGLLLAAVQEAFIHGLRIVEVDDERSEVHSELAWALERWSREVAQAKTFTTAEDSRLVVTVDLNQDSTDETVEFVLSSGRLLRQEAGRQVVLVRNVQSLAFAYLDLDGTPLSTPVASGSLDDIRVVRVSLTGDVEDETVSLASAVFVRNLFYAGAS